VVECASSRKMKKPVDLGAAVLEKKGTNQAAECCHRPMVA
jgi:hypothetical protein